MLAQSISDALDAAIKADESLSLHLDGPPCADCAFWRPTLPRDVTGGYRPILLCHVGQSITGGGMKPDFSCFTAKPEKAESRDTKRPAAEPQQVKPIATHVPRK